MAEQEVVTDTGWDAQWNRAISATEREPLPMTLVFLPYGLGVMKLWPAEASQQ